MPFADDADDDEDDKAVCALMPAERVTAEVDRVGGNAAATAAAVTAAD